MKQTVNKNNLIKIRGETDKETIYTYVTKNGLGRLTYNPYHDVKYGFINIYNNEGVFKGLKHFITVREVRRYVKSGKYTNKELVKKQSLRKAKEIIRNYHPPKLRIIKVRKQTMFEKVKSWFI